MSAILSLLKGSAQAEAPGSPETASQPPARGARGGALLAAALGLSGWVTGLAGADAATPTISTNRLLAGSRFAAACYVHDSGLPGPAVLIVGGVHGSEPAGALAAEALRHWPITRGRLIVLPRANVPALEARKYLTPGVGTNLANLNRNYAKADEPDPARGELAQAIWGLTREHKPDWLLDLHESVDSHHHNPRRLGSTVIAFPSPNGLAAADHMAAAVNATITNASLKFERRTLPVNGSLARAAGEHLRVPAMILETTATQPLAVRVHQHQILVHALLRHLDMVFADLPPAARIAGAEISMPAAQPEKSSASVKVALYQGPGTTGQGPPNLMKQLNRRPDMSLTEVSPDEIRQGVLTNYHAVIFAGGSGSGQAEALGQDGRAALQRFVAGGGGYLGICAGAYLAASGFTWSLHLVDAKTVSPKWRRGRGRVQIELTERGRAILGATEGRFEVKYENGPIVEPAGVDALPDFEPLACFRTELAENNTPVGVMVNSPAILAARYHQGRVVCVSPHPEQTPGLEDMIPRAVAWVTASGPPAGQTEKP